MHRAYRDLDHQGLTEGRPGAGTFIKRTLAKQPPEQDALREQLETWVDAARAAGLGDEAITALMADALHKITTKERV